MNYFNRLLIAVLVITLLTTAFVTAEENPHGTGPSAKLSLSYFGSETNNKLVSFYTKNSGEVMLSVLELLQAMDVTHWINTDSCLVLYPYLSSLYVFDFNSNTLNVNGVLFADISTTEHIDGNIYMPLSELPGLLKISTSYDKDSESLKIKYVDKGVMELLKTKIVSSPVLAEISKKCKAYTSSSMSKKAADLQADTKVELLEERNATNYLIRTLDGETTGWVSKKNLKISEDPDTNEKLLEDFELETYVNGLGFTSSSDYFVWVDIDRQYTYIFKTDGNWWHIDRKMLCATGKNISPTKRGLFSIGDRGKWFYVKRFASGAKFWVRYSGTYLFHSIAMDKNKDVQDATLGIRVSSGCIRLSEEDSEWFYTNIVETTSVYLN